MVSVINLRTMEMFAGNNSQLLSLAKPLTSSYSHESQTWNAVWLGTLARYSFTVQTPRCKALLAACLSSFLIHSWNKSCAGTEAAEPCGFCWLLCCSVAASQA